MKLGDIELNDFQVRALKQQLTGIGHDREVERPTRSVWTSPTRPATAGRASACAGNARDLALDAT